MMLHLWLCLQSLVKRQSQEIIPRRISLHALLMRDGLDSISKMHMPALPP